MTSTDHSDDDRDDTDEARRSRFQRKARRDCEQVNPAVAELDALMKT